MRSLRVSLSINEVNGLISKELGSSLSELSSSDKPGTGNGVYCTAYFSRLSVFSELLASLAPPPLILVREKRALRSMVMFLMGLWLNFRFALSRLKSDICMMALSSMCE